MSAVAHGNFSGKRLVVFGCGYVGSTVARQAQQREVRVTALTRNPTWAETLRSEGIDVIVADLADRAWHKHIPGGADFVLNSVSSGGGGVEGYEQSYLQGLASISDWAAQVGCADTFVYTSSTSVYPQDGGVVVDETSPTAPTNDRVRILLETEERFLAARGVMYARGLVLRLAGIYGPGRHHLLDQLRACATEIGGNGEHRLNLAHRDDIAAAIWSAFASRSGVSADIVNVADDAPARKAEVVAWLAQRLNVPMPRFTGEPTSGRRAITPDRIISNAKLKRGFGWRPQFPDFRVGYEKILSP